MNGRKNPSPEAGYAPKGNYPLEECSYSEAEILAILIGGNRLAQPALEIADELLGSCAGSLTELSKRSPAQLMRIKGMTPARATAIRAAFELGRRRQAAHSLPLPVIEGSRPAAGFLQARFGDLSQEVFAVVFLNQANRILSYEIVSTGGLTSTIADLRIIIKRALEEQAVNLILCHNHPSGNLKPSDTDEELTRQIGMAAKFFNIKVLDHIIVTAEGYFSFADHGLI